MVNFPQKSTGLGLGDPIAELSLIRSFDEIEPNNENFQKTPNFNMTLAKVGRNLWTGNFGNLIFLTFLTIPETAQNVRAIFL